MSAPRCTYCDARLTHADGCTRVPHLSWCPRAPHEPSPERRPLVADDRPKESKPHSTTKTTATPPERKTQS